ncbi:MAG: ABC transporter ATP-binding protein [Candidatus Heimdallarchaeota archaeon]|nr:ABC transporter ATP-binding protein [Candidatus Heimdallarchaeota archaeon]MCK4971795.1 ABC transporter ATP-binding protein [Candidatus Heimdallarchaeota archaeon]
MSKKIISVENLTKTYVSKAEELKVLKGTSFDINRGDVICLLGISGSGKTTILNIIAGLDAPTSGRVLYSGENIGEWTLDKLYDFRLREIGIIFQEFYLLEHLTSLENVMAPMILAGKTENEAQERALELLTQVGLRRKAMNHPEELSSGERQRICIARAIANYPSILIADEPTGTLDSKTGDEIMNLLLGIAKKRQMTVIYTTHDPYVTKLAKRIFLMQNGLVVENGQSSFDNIEFDETSFKYKFKGDKK